MSTPARISATPKEIPMASKVTDDLDFARGCATALWLGVALNLAICWALFR